MSAAGTTTCEVVTQWDGGRIAAQCGRPVRYRYAAMGGGYMHLCAGCGRRHVRIAEELTADGWAPTPEAAALPVGPDNRALGRLLCATMRLRRWTPEDVAARTGYARATVLAWRTGNGMSRPARRAIATLTGAGA